MEIATKSYLETRQEERRLEGIYGGRRLGLDRDSLSSKACERSGRWITCSILSQ